MHNIIGLGTGAFVLLLSLIQISPLKLNPWDGIFSWLGKKLNSDTESRLDKLQKQVASMWVSSRRNAVLSFARECRSGIEHSPDEWMNVLNLAEEYEKHVIENHITNGIVTQDTAYLRNLYQELSHERRL